MRICVVPCRPGSSLIVISGDAKRLNVSGPLLPDMVIRGTFLMDDETLFRESLIPMAARETKH